MSKIIILWICMVFFHILDDFVLQGWLAQAKQKKFWQENAPDKLYRNDYKIALLIHGFSWACSVHIPVLLFCGMFERSIPFLTWFIMFNCHWLIHSYVDNLKANKHKINLIQDQLIHIGQISLMWLAYILVM